MANPDHIWIIRQGNQAINQWKSRHPDAGLDLFKADLRRDNLSDLDLSEADLRNADLIETDLSDADLTEAIFTDAKLRQVKLNNVTGYNLTSEQEAENAKKITKRIMGTGYLIILISVLIFLGLIAMGTVFPPSTDNPGQLDPAASGIITFLAMGILLIGFLTGSVYFATDKGYSGELGFIITFCFILTAYLLLQVLLAEFIGVAFFGPIVLALLPDKNQRRTY